MKLFTKKLVSSLLAGVLLLSSSIPALASSNQNMYSNMYSSIDNTRSEDGKVEAQARTVMTIVLRALAIYVNGVKKYEKVRESKIEDAIKDEFGITFYTSGRNIETWKVGRGKTVVLECGDDSGHGMEHILAKHVPRYFNQYDAAEDAMEKGKTITLFDPDTTVRDVYENLDYVIKRYESRISQQHFNKGVERFYVEGNDNKDYVLIIKDGKIITFYPDDWNRASILEDYQGPGIPT